MNSAKIVPFIDMQVEKPNTYKMIKNDGTEELVKLEFAPGIIYQEGTKDNAENFNTIQNNAVYRVDGTRVLEATEEIYDINIVNYNNYTPNDLTIIMNVDVSNTSNSPKIRLNNIKYNIVNESGNVPINFLINKNTFIFVLDFNKKTAKITSGDYKLKPATTSIIGGVKPDGTTLTVDINGLIKTVDNKFFTNNGIPMPAGTNLNTFLTKGHYTSVDNATTATMFNTPFGSMSFTLVVDGIQGNNLFISQLATYYIDGTIAQRITLDAGITWTPWIEIINKTTGDATYVKKVGDTMTGGLRAAALTITNGTNETNITARYNNLATDTMSIYNNATNTGIYNNMPTHGNISIFSRSKSTGVVSYAGGNYGTINGSTATFSGNVTAPSITIGEYVVTIV